MSGDPEVNYFPSSVADHKPDVRQAKPNGGDNDEAHRNDVAFVVSEKRLPPLALIVVRRSLREIPRDGGETHGETQLF